MSRYLTKHNLRDVRTIEDEFHFQVEGPDEARDPSHRQLPLG